MNVQPKEAIQLDAVTKNAMGWSGITDNMYNGNGCHKVLIRNNTFTNYVRAVGSYSYPQGVEKNPYTYITLTKNRIAPSGIAFTRN